MSLEQTGLPPRRHRRNRPAGPFSFKRIIQSGLVVFGALFFGVIGIELYQAKVSKPPAAEGGPVVTTEPAGTGDDQDKQSAAAGAVEPNASSAPVTVASSATQGQPTPTLPSRDGHSAAPPASTQEMGQTAGTVPSSGRTEEKGAKASQGTGDNPGPASNSQKPVTSSTAQKPKAVKHVVQKGETLYMLSRKYYGNNSNVARIASYNGLSAEAQLTAGKVILVPLSP